MNRAVRKHGYEAFRRAAKSGGRPEKSGQSGGWQWPKAPLRKPVSEGGCVGALLQRAELVEVLRGVSILWIQGQGAAVIFDGQRFVADAFVGFG